MNCCGRVSVVVDGFVTIFAVAAGNDDVPDMHRCCRRLNVYLFEVIDCCMSESGDVIIVDLDTLSFLGIYPHQWSIDDAAYQWPTRCLLLMVVRAQYD